MHIFDRSGIAAVSDLETAEWRELFGELEGLQAPFRAFESKFRSPGYSWPLDPLHSWSRCWEYPFAFYHLRQRAGRGVLVDLGSGVTFFPFVCAGLGYHVICTDTDRICQRDIPRAAEILDRDVSFRWTNGTTLPFNDGEVDVLTCLSVLEHIPHWEWTVLEVARVLRPGGHLILTFDLDLLGNAALGVGQYRGLRHLLRERFDLVYPERSVHPLDVLDSTRGPYPLGRMEGWRRGVFYAKQVIKPLFGRKPMLFAGGLHLAVQGMVMERRSTAR